MMCEHCRSIQTWRKFDAPRDYLACIAYMHCGQIFTCVVNTWRGSGHFKKGKN